MRRSGGIRVRVSRGGVSEGGGGEQQGGLHILDAGERGDPAARGAARHGGTATLAPCHGYCGDRKMSLLP